MIHRHEPARRDSVARRARIAVAVIFFVNGAVMGTWVPLIPAVQQRLALGPGVLGLALLGTAGGALLAMPSAGALIARLGSRPVTVVGALAFCASLPLPIFAPTLATLAISLFLLGASSGVMDVAMNSQAVGVEKLFGRPIMSSFHALFSFGGLAGAGAVSLGAAANVDPRSQVLVSALLLGFAVLPARRHLLVGRQNDEGGHAFARITRPLLVLGLIGFCCLFAEGAMADWSAVYLRHVLGTDLAVAAWGYAGFSLAMAVSRLTGDQLTHRLGPALMIRLGGTTAALGLTLALLIQHPIAAVLGFGFVGFGLANVFPLLLSAAGRFHSLSAGAAIAAVATASYTGSLSGPGLIGFAAQVSSLSWALALVVVASLVISSLAPGIEGPRESEHQRAG